MNRIYLSPPHMSGREQSFVAEAFESNWIAPLGPNVDAFEREFAARIGIAHAIALSSGTAAMHLALRALRLTSDDEIFCSTLTFSASVNPIIYEGGTPVFIDSDFNTWNINPSLLAEELSQRARRGKLPRAVIAVDLYGQCADHAQIVEICRRFEVTLIEDAAEALGATCHGKQAGTFGWANIFSFNGNKIITTSGGGMLATDDEHLAQSARFLSQQARDPAPHYEHSQIGYNYRLSNVLAGIGRGQLQVLDERIVAKRRNFEFYKKSLGEVAGISFMPEAEYGTATRWLTCLMVDEEIFGASREDVRLHLEAHNIEARPTWKPMHMQPVFEKYKVVGGCVAKEIFEKGLCLPSGSSLSVIDLERVIETFLATPRRAAKVS
ncbi:MAG: aminotransferase class I/II-fold pyridoxal phosphate-dependent enzyme [Pyrinomonadaceae bacterium]